jgi:hypothetical protein
MHLHRQTTEHIGPVRHPGCTNGIGNEHCSLDSLGARE